MFRDLVPKDFYFFAYIQDEIGDEMTEFEKSFCLIAEISHDPELLLPLPLPQFNKIIEVVVNNIFKEKLMSPNDWLELAFHLCKQRWDDSVDWLETQPMSKVSLMMQIVVDHAEKMKNANKV